VGVRRLDTQRDDHRSNCDTGDPHPTLLTIGSTAQIARC
jgi:hypothetical protein